MFVLVIVAGLASHTVNVKAANEDGCDGPVDVPAVSQDCAAYSATWEGGMYSVGSCDCGVIHAINYNTCGGSGWKACKTKITAVGNYCPCIPQVSYTALFFWHALYYMCASKCPEDREPQCPVDCVKYNLNPSFWTSCVADTSDKTTVYGFVIGDGSNSSPCP